MSKTLGKYGIIYKNYLIENHKKSYKELQSKGQLLDHCVERGQELKELYMTIEKQFKSLYPRPNTDNFLELAQYENFIASTVNELLLDNISL